MWNQNQVFYISILEFVIYNAGSDILRNDPLGALDITIECMKQRDLRMF